MRYAKGHKTTTRKGIIEVASKRFRKEGVEGVGIAALMSDAGLTHGGFYAHFDSKEELFQEAMAHALDQTQEKLTRLAEADGGGLEAMIRDYLEPWHRRCPERGCAAASLGADIARYSRPTRVVFEKKLEGLIALIARHLPRGDRHMRRRVAIAIFGTMMGTLQLARAVADRRLSDQILESGVEAALNLARGPET